MADEISHKSIRYKPGEIQFHDGRKLPIIKETANGYVTLDGKTEGLALKSDEGPSFKVNQLPAQKSNPKHILSPEHAHHPLNEEQRQLIDGLDVENPTDREMVRQGIHTEFNNPPYNMPGVNGARVFIKHSPTPEIQESLVTGATQFPLHTREQAFYRASKDGLGLDLVTPTVSVETHKGPATISAWVDGHHPYADDLPETMKTVPQGDIEKALVNDYILGNADRHDGNFKVHNGKLQLFDHGDAFSNHVNSVTKPMYADHIQDNQVFLPETHSWVKSIDPAKLQQSLTDSGVPAEYASQAMTKLANVQKAAKSKKNPITKGSLFASPVTKSEIPGLVVPDFSRIVQDGIFIVDGLFPSADGDHDRQVFHFGRIMVNDGFTYVLEDHRNFLARQFPDGGIDQRKAKRWYQLLHNPHMQVTQEEGRPAHPRAEPEHVYEVIDEDGNKQHLLVYPNDHLTLDGKNLSPQDAESLFEEIRSGKLSLSPR